MEYIGIYIPVYTVYWNICTAEKFAALSVLNLVFSWGLVVLKALDYPEIASCVPIIKKKKKRGEETPS